jgi:hypothetical protein
MVMTHAYRKWPLAVRVIPIVVLIAAIKLIIHYVGFEVISLNPLFSGLVAGNVFLMGFLLTGVLSDYKESEKLPGEIATSIEAIHDEASIIWNIKNAPVAKECLQRLFKLANMIMDWLYRKVSTSELMAQVEGMNACFAAFEPLTAPQFLGRMKVEQTNLRRMIIRIHTIRETSFVSSGYTIAKITTILLSLGLIMSKIDTFYESFFFVGAITYLLVFMLLLIQDLDNPFGYYEATSSEDVSLKPIQDIIVRLKEHF